MEKQLERHCHHNCDETCWIDFTEKGRDTKEHTTLMPRDLHELVTYAIPVSFAIDAYALDAVLCGLRAQS